MGKYQDSYSGAQVTASDTAAERLDPRRWTAVKSAAKKSESAKASASSSDKK